MGVDELFVLNTSHGHSFQADINYILRESILTSCERLKLRVSKRRVDRLYILPLASELT